MVKQIPADFREYITEMVFKHMCQLIESPELRKRLGMAALNVARTKFGFETRNQKMLAVYSEALQWTNKTKMQVYQHQFLETFIVANGV